jgi:hypothetical protein
VPSSTYYIYSREFDLRLVHVGFLVDNVALRQAFLRILACQNYSSNGAH